MAPMKSKCPEDAPAAVGPGRAASGEAAVSAFLAPLCLLVAVFILLPVLGTIADSFFLDVPYRGRRFVGPDNFLWLAQDPAFLQALRFTGLFVLVSVPIEILLGLMVALVLNEPVKLRGLLRAVVLVPWAIPAAASGRVFELIYNYSFGAANALLQRAGLIDAPVNWLGSGAGAFAALAAADVWRTTPFAAIILLAGLSGIPEDIYRQAKVDRATFLQRFSRITLPLITPVLLITVVLRTIDALRVFDLVFVLTGGGPGGATTSVSLFSYGYLSGGDFGYGSAAGVVLFVLALGLSVVVLKTGRLERGLG